MNARLKQLSICACGYPALREEIPLGTEYDLKWHATATFSWRCGGCGERQSIIGVWVESRNGGKPGYLPVELFEKVEGEEHD